MYQIPSSLYKACRKQEDTVDKFVIWLDKNPKAEVDANNNNDNDKDLDQNFGTFLVKYDLKNSSSYIKNINKSTQVSILQVSFQVPLRV